MPSTFTGIEIGKRSLFAHQQGLHTVGHNLSNADKDGYSRQRVEMNPADPIFMPAMNREERAGQLGQASDQLAGLATELQSLVGHFKT